MIAGSPPSIYADDVDWPSFGEPPEGDQHVDVAVVGGGFTGVSVALNLAEKGYSVHLYEAERIGYGASGRNGGQLCQGWTTDFSKVAGRLPASDRRMAWDVGVMGRQIIIDRCERHGIDPDLRFGYLYGGLHQRHMNELQDMKDEWAGEGYKDLELLPDAAAMAPHINTDEYVGGMLDHGSGHLNPLKYLHGLAGAAKSAGAVIHEHCRINRIVPGEGEGASMLHHDHGVVRADRLVLAGNAYLDRTAPRMMQQRLAPVTSAIMATAPISDNQIRDLIPDRVAVADCNTALNYYRFDARGRMLFGGRASYLAQEGNDIRRDLTRRMLRVFPSLKGVEVEKTWWGRIGITVDRIPHFGKIGQNTWFVQGFSGHGVALSGTTGMILAEAVAGDPGRFDAFASIRHLPFPGGIFRTPALAIGMAWYKLRDQLKL